MIRSASAAQQSAAQSELSRCGPGIRPNPGNPVFMPRRGLQFPGHLPFEKWLTIGRQLSEICTSSAWCLGDWLAYGEFAYSGRYREAIEQTSLDYQTLRNYAWVAKRFTLSRRRDALSFGHHTEVAALPESEQDFWLRKAEELGWSCKRLRQEVRVSLKERADYEQPAIGQTDDMDTNSPQSVRLNVLLSANLMETCQAAAARAGLNTDVWACLVLEQAASQWLGNYSESA